MRAREATVDEIPGIANVLDGAALAVDHDRLRERVRGGDALVAVRSGASSAPVLGALVLDGERVAAVAVRPNRRGQGIGSALVESARNRRDRLTAEFDAELRPFYERLAFAVEPAGDPARLRGVWPAE